MWIELFLFVVLVCVYFIMRDRKPAGMPPGPFEIPFIGNVPIFDEKTAEKLKQKYGNIVCVRTGNMRTVMIFDYALGKEVMGRLEMTGRPEFFRTFSLDDQCMGGLVGSEGPQWQHDRRFVLRNLRNLGMGKSYLEDAINFEAQALVDDLKKYDEKPIKFPDSFRTAVLNIIWQMVASKRYDLRSTEVEKVYELNKAFQNLPVYTLLPLFFPTLKKIIPRFILNKYFAEEIFNEFLERLRVIFEKCSIEHEANQDLDDPRDLMDEYLKEMKEREDEGNNDFCRKGALNQIISDLFNAGSDTVNNMLKWVSYLLALYPEVAERMHQEIDKVVPRNRLVSLDDKPNLAYVEAFVNEALRFSSMIVMNVQRTATRDTSIEKYSIPKGTIVTVCNYSCHFDPKYWDEPYKFNPERFLTKDGKFQAPKAGFFAFGSGRRQCLGELLARMELFLFTAAIAQNFDIEAPEGVKLPHEPLNLMGLRVPVDTSLVYKNRK